MRVSRWSVRAQFLSMIVVVLVPVFSALGWYLIDARQSARDNAYFQVKNLADQVASNLMALVDRNEAVLRQMAIRPLVQAMNPGQCDPILGEYVSLHPELANIVVTDLHGDVVCATLPGTVTTPALKARPWFDQMLRSEGFLVGDAFVGPITKRWVTMVSHPVRDVAGKISGFVLFPTDLLKLNAILLRSVPADVLVTVTDRDRKIILRSVAPESFIGRPTPAPVLQDTIGQTQGHLSAKGIDGVRRLFAFTEIPGTGFRVVAGVREDEAFAESDLALRNGVAAGIALLLGSLFMAWRISLRIVQPIDALATVAAQVALGDVKSRALTNQGPREIETVARAFNHMLDARSQFEVELNEREQRLKFLLSRTSAAIFTSKASGDFAMTFVSDSVQDLLGYSPGEFLNTPGFWAAHLHPDDLARHGELMRSLFEHDMLATEYRFMHQNGSYRWVHDELRLYRDASGEPIEIIGFLVDVTESRKAQDKLRFSEARFRTLTELGSDWYWEQDDQFRFVQIEGSLRGANGLPADAYVGRTRWEAPHFGVTEAQWDAHRAVLLAHETFKDFEMQRPGLNGAKTWVSLSGTPIFNENGVFCGYRGIGRDIMANKQAAEQIHALAFYDSLTALPNRRLLMEQLKKALLTHVRSGRLAALLFIDLDNFKTLNDTLGHDTGDLLLQQVAKRLIACVREADTVARLGGDEFVVILEDLESDPDTAAAHAQVVAQKIISVLNEPYTLSQRTHHSTPSIGITLFGESGQELDELLRQADLAMYQAKAAGRNTLRFFDARMQTAISNRVALEADLRDGLRREELFLHYQPVVLGTGVVTGAEALVRWQHPLRGVVAPAEFIPLAEATGMIMPLGNWVLQTACAQLVAWAANPQMAHLTLAVNVSTLQFLEPDFVTQVLAVLAATGANPQRLKLELTESLLADDVDDIIVKMTVLKDHGVSFSLDDFGTGYSSLSYLKRLPLDQLKIDQSFVRDVLIDPNDAAIARTIVALGASLGLAVMAEGVETEGQRGFLALNGCHVYQGYLFSRPLPIAEFDAFVLGQP
jgi:diguanylate cyclase (GGDEF)-like protein/PAS domain S-box-containing protein